MARYSTLAKLRAFLDMREPELVQFLVTLWHNQGRAITYKELREALLNGEMTASQLEAWQEDYSAFVVQYLHPLYLAAIDAAAADLDGWLVASGRALIRDWFDPAAEGTLDWCRTRGAAFVTNSSQLQLDALNAVITRAAVLDALGVDELARVIRPMVGLTKQQAIANLNYYTALCTRGRKKQNGEIASVGPKKARELSIRYAARQHRYRGYNIARTELAFAYNKGADTGIRQAQGLGLMGDCVKVWSAARDERTCPICGALDGQRIAMDEDFDYETKLAGRVSTIRRTPPAHPSCRCGIKYEEISPPVMR
ncbi:MAG: phage minor head protein [Peptococcaceae bacterium]|nr:phage minor head protein [Peptococcaceae bacterium]